MDPVKNTDQVSTMARNSYKCCGLFAGIGGVELGMARAGHETNLFCELDSAASAVLKARFPSVPIHDDISSLDALPEGTNLLAAGFPCQDLSQAGVTKGIEGARSGLVAQVFRLISQQRVEKVLLENVPFMLQLRRGNAMEVIVSTLESLGYKWAYRVMDSRAFGVPQRRQRVYLLASLDDDPRDVLLSDDLGELPEEAPWRSVACGFYWTEGIRGLGWALDAIPTLKGGSTVGIPSPPAMVFPSGFVGKPDIRDAERLQGFEAGWSEPASEAGRESFRWKLVGNAVTVGAAHWIGEKLGSPTTYHPGLDAPMRTDRAWPKAAWNVGDGRHEAFVSPFPCAAPTEHLADFLRFDPAPLSAKATRGFLGRTERSSLRFPPGFIDVVRSHLERVEEVPYVA